MGTWINGLFFTALGALAVWLFWSEVQRKLAAVRQAKGPLPTDQPARRRARVISEVLFQTRVIRHRPLPGLAHAFLLWAFLAFGLESLDHLSHIWLPHGFLPTAGLFHDLFQGLVALFAWAAGAGILYLAFRRFVSRPKVLGELSATSGLVSLFILTLMLTFLAKHHGWVDGDGLSGYINWALHTVTLFAFLALIPRSKHLHLVLGPAALSRATKSRATLR